MLARTLTERRAALGLSWRRLARLADVDLHGIAEHEFMSRPGMGVQRRALEATLEKLEHEQEIA